MPDRVTPAEFRAAMAELPAAVTVVTAWSPDGGPTGATVSAATSLSLDPPMLLVCLAETSDTLKALEPGAPFALHVLCDGEQELALRMAGKGPGKFEGLDYVSGESGAPELAGCGTVVACDVASRMQGGDHVVVFGNIRTVRTRPSSRALVYHRRRMHATAGELA